MHRYPRVDECRKLTWLAVSSSTAAPQLRALPSAFEKYVATTVRPTARERQTLM
jgi:hypothetical protein